MDILHIFMPYIGAFMATFSFLFLPVGLLLPEKYNKWFFQILSAISIVIAVAFINYKSDPVPTIKNPVKKKESGLEKDVKYCIHEEKQKGRNKADAEMFCYYECIITILDFGDDDYSGAESRCGSLFED